MKNLKIKNNLNNKIEEVYFKILDKDNINEVIHLQEHILSSLDDNKLYAPSEREEFLEYIKLGGTILGLLTKENDTLIALGVYIAKGLRKDNYGYDLNFDEKTLLKVGQIESTIVKSEYRGNKIQKIICEKLEEIGIKNGESIFMATVSPYNEFSLNTFLSLGYEIKCKKIKYGGYERYIIIKIYN